MSEDIDKIFIPGVTVICKSMTECVKNNKFQMVIGYILENKRLADIIDKRLWCMIRVLFYLILHLAHMSFMHFSEL